MHRAKQDKKTLGSEEVKPGPLTTMLCYTGTINHTALPEHKFENIHIYNILVSKGSD